MKIHSIVEYAYYLFDCKSHFREICIQEEIFNQIIEIASPLIRSTGISLMWTHL